MSRRPLRRRERIRLARENVAADLLAEYRGEYLLAAKLMRNDVLYGVTECPDCGALHVVAGDCPKMRGRR